MSDIHILFLLTSGILGLGFWFSAIADNLYRIGMPRTRRSSAYDRLDSIFIGIGSVLIVAFVGDLYVIVATAIR